MLDENNERIRMPTKNKRARPWMLEIRYTQGFAIKGGWINWGKYRTKEEAEKAVAHHQRTWGASMDVRVSRLDNVTKA